MEGVGGGLEVQQGGAGGVGSNSKSHSGSDGERWPRRTGRPWWVMVTEEASKLAVKPWSHRSPMEMREHLKEGNMWHTRACSGTWGRLRSAVWDDVAEVPSGSVTVMGDVVGMIFIRHAASCMAM